MLSQDTIKIDIFDILKKYFDAEIFKIQTYDCIRQRVAWVYYFRLNKEYKIQIQKNEYFTLRTLGIKEIII